MFFCKSGRLTTVMCFVFSFSQYFIVYFFHWHLLLHWRLFQFTRSAHINNPFTHLSLSHFYEEKTFFLCVLLHCATFVKYKSLYGNDFSTLLNKDRWRQLLTVIVFTWYISKISELTFKDIYLDQISMRSNIKKKRRTKRTVTFLNLDISKFHFLIQKLASVSLSLFHGILVAQCKTDKKLLTRNATKI